MVVKGQPMVTSCHKMTDPKVLAIFIGKTVWFYRTEPDVCAHYLPSSKIIPEKPSPKTHR